MQPTLEVDNFISRIVALPPGPGVSLDGALQPCLDDEAELRRLFATDRKHARLVNPYVGLVDVFAAPDAIRKTRARVIKDKDDLTAHYVMPPRSEDRREEGSPAMVADLEEFRKNWAIFTEGSLSQLLDWNNVVAAGGSVLACLTPLDEGHKTSKRATRKFYHSKAYPTSDVDLFLWGLTPKQAEAKIKAIYEAVRDSVPWDVTCIRTKHTVSIHSQYPYRSVQIVLRLYQSPAEILAGFDIDAPCCAYDGQRVWANPRAVVAMMRQCNTVDMTRRSPSYEVRLAKYSRRAYEVYVPDLKRGEIDPTIFERSIARIEGLARLLVLEKLADDGIRTAFLQGRRHLRGRPAEATLRQHRRSNKRKYKGDLKQDIGMGIEMNDYDVASLHIPYGPGWDARRIDRLIYQTDLGMNSTFNPKNKGRRLHRHPAFFGNVDECLEDCCEYCPAPIDEDERKLKEEEDESYVSGRIKFIEENPGRQSITGSFNPIDVGEWSEQVYIKPTEQLFTAIASRDRATVQQLLKSEDIDVNRRDYVGRITLHVAIVAKATDIAIDLIDAGARITARLADGRAPLHLAAQYDEPVVIQKLFERSARNLAEQKNNEQGDIEMGEESNQSVRASSDDDWSSHDDEDVDISGSEDEDDVDHADDSEGGKKSQAHGQNASPPAQLADAIPDDEKDQPDIIEVDALDWDIGFSALAYAITYSSLATLNTLLEGGADPKVPSKQTDKSHPLHPLTLTILREDEDEACKLAERLLQLPGVTSSTADEQMQTIFHKAVVIGRTKLVETLLRCDPHATTVLDFPSIKSYQTVMFPVVTAIERHHFAVLGIMLAYGAKLDFAEQDVTTALDTLPATKKSQVMGYGPIRNYLQLAHQPVEAAISVGSDIATLLVALGANANIGLKHSVNMYAGPSDRRSLIDWFEYALNNLDGDIATRALEIENKALQDAEKLELERLEKDKLQENTTGWKRFHSKYIYDVQFKNTASLEVQDRVNAQGAHSNQQMLDRFNDTKEFLLEIRDTLKACNAKTWDQIYPSLESEARAWAVGPKVNRYERKTGTMLLQSKKTQNEAQSGYVYLGGQSYNRQYVPEYLVEKYDELYEACFSGDNDKIQLLCLPIEGQNATIAQGLPPPLNISVRQVDPSISNYDEYGYTPLFAAISGRRWSTAKLVLAIATAQYAPEEKEDEIKFEVDVDMGDESDPDSAAYDSDATDGPVERRDTTFVDIATRPSIVKSDTHPKVMLQDTMVKWVKSATEVTSGPQYGQDGLLGQSIANGDIEAFVQICNLYGALPDPLDISANATLQKIINHDQAQILDEYIRRTGDGLDIEAASTAGGKGDESDLPAVVNDENRTYLGLNVHGKKRMDLANKNDPNATGQTQPVIQPLVWRAAAIKAKNIIEYLSSDRPFAAYKRYASTQSSPRAIWLRRMANSLKEKLATGGLQKKLPIWLGWHINSVGESPLSAAIASDDLDTIKLLAKLQPSLMAQALQARIKFTGANMMNLAVGRGCNTKIIDYLLSRKVSPTERLTSQGWNIYHQICGRKDTKQLEYFLAKLPKDVNEVLLSQQSTFRLNTPLHIAADSGSVAIVKILVNYSPSTLLTLNVDGQTPLHRAAEYSYAQTVKIMLDAAPPAVIHMEDCVGVTLYEAAALRGLGQRLSKFKFSGNVIHASELSTHLLPGNRNPFDVCVENESRLADMLAALQTSGGKNKAQVLSICAKWASDREAKAQLLKERKSMRDKRENDYQQKWGVYVRRGVKEGVDRVDVQQTLRYIHKAAIAANSTDIAPPRRLIHLFEVQQSVAATLSSVRGENKSAHNDDKGSNRLSTNRRRRLRAGQVEGELEEEENVEVKERRASMVLQWLSPPSGVDFK